MSFRPSACPTVLPTIDMRLIGVNSINSRSAEQQFSDYRRAMS
jgi:hypothetical protein